MIHELQPHCFNNQYQPNKTIAADDYIFHFVENTLLLRPVGDSFELPRLKELGSVASRAESRYLFSLDGVSCFLVCDRVRYDEDLFRFEDIGFFRFHEKQEIAFASIVAFHIRNWYGQNKFCGRCGAGNVHKVSERAMECPECGIVFYPKIPPAVIVAITSGDQLLLARGTNFRNGWYSLLAGYVDVGESLEEAVVREVKEEVGVDVWNIRYYKSQPWPLSGSMMVGFVAEADVSQPLILEEKEIAHAGWFDRDNLPEHPSAISIAGEIIEKFKKGETLVQ